MINGIFGKKKRLWGDEPNQWDIKEMPTGSGAGMPGPEAMGQQPQPKGPSFLNRGLDFASGVADTMIQLRGGPPTHSLMKQRLAQQQFAEAQYERKRTDDFTDAMAMQKYKTENPAQTATQRDVEWIMSLPEDQRKEAFRVMQAKQPTFFNGWDGGRYQNGGEEVLGAELPEGYSIQGGPASAPGNFPRPR